MLTSSGYLARVDQDLCISCGDCEEYCQFGSLELGDLFMEVNYDKCMGCGVCVDKCQQGALALVKDGDKGMPLEICVLMEPVA